MVSNAEADRMSFETISAAGYVILSKPLYVAES